MRRSVVIGMVVLSCAACTDQLEERDAGEIDQDPDAGTRGDDAPDVHETEDLTNICRTTWFVNGVASADYVEEIHYDDQGRRSKLTWDDGADGTIDFTHTYIYDDNHGRLLQRNTQNDADDRPDKILRYEWTDGLLSYRELDVNADGLPEQRITFTYDERGLRIRAEADREVDGTVDVLVVDEYDDRGLLVRQEVTTGGTTIFTYEYDEQGRRVRIEEDQDADGAPEGAILRSYDAQGRLVSREHDWGVDGNADSMERYVWDEESLVEQRYDYGANGSTESKLVFEGDCPNTFNDRLSPEFSEGREGHGPDFW